MKQIANVVLLTILSAAAGFSSTCAPGTLASYLSLGSTGCTIGANTIYGFQLPTETTAGATEITADAITVTPTGGTVDPGLTFTVTESAPANTILEALFGYSIAGGSYGGDSIALSGASQTADGSVTYIQNYCAGGTFAADGFSGCGGSTGSLLALYGVQNGDSTALSTVGPVSVTDDLTFDGGSSGTASGGVVADAFTAVPEPSGFFLMGLAGAVAAAWKGRRLCGEFVRR